MVEGAHGQRKCGWCRRSGRLNSVVVREVSQGVEEMRTPARRGVRRVEFGERTTRREQNSECVTLRRERCRIPHDRGGYEIIARSDRRRTYGASCHECANGQAACAGGHRWHCCCEMKRNFIANVRGVRWQAADTEWARMCERYGCGITERCAASTERRCREIMSNEAYASRNNRRSR